MNYVILLLLTLYFNLQMVTGQIAQDEKTISDLANDILEQTEYGFINKNNQQVVKVLDSSIPVSDLELISRYTDWKYWNGVLNIALLKYADFSNNKDFRKLVFKNYEFAFKHKTFFTENYPKGHNRWNYPFGLFVRIDELDDCGAMGAGLIEVYKYQSRKEYKDYIDEAAAHMLMKQHQLDDGTFVRAFPQKYTLWADDLYMSIVFLARMGNLTGEQKYFDLAAQQVIHFNKYLFNHQKQLYYHCYYTKDKRNGVAHWGRSNGWVMFAQAELLEFLPVNHPQRETLLSIFEQQIIGVSRYQTSSGLWRQLLDKDDSYEETSVTAMFAYSIAKGINCGWIDKRYASIAENAWSGIKSKINKDGKVEGICAGTGIDESLSYYYNRPTPLNDIHGLGAVLLAGMEMLNLNSKVRE